MKKVLEAAKGDKYELSILLAAWVLDLGLLKCGWFLEVQPWICVRVIGSKKKY